MEFQNKCPSCGHPRQEGALFCSNCGKPFEEPKSETPSPEPGKEEPIKPPFPAEPLPPAPERKYVAWEDRENTGFFQGLWTTWKESVFYPNRFFSQLPFRGGIGSPLLYALIIVWMGVAVKQLWGLLFTGIWLDIVSGYFPMEDYFWVTGFQTGFSLLYLILAPIPILIGLFVISGIYHLILMIFGWAERDFEATFRVFAYASGPLVFEIVPACGGTIGWIWALVLAIIGIKHMQKTSGGNAALVIFLPIILCCCLIIIIGLIFGAAMVGFMQNIMNEGYFY